jgi:hypothetical protein
VITGRTVVLLEKQQTGVDAFNRPTYAEVPVEIENVLIAPLSDQEVLETLNLTGRKAVYQLGIPKGDAHDWENQRVQFFGQTWQVIGIPTEGQDELIPLFWNKKVKVERYG